MSPPTISVVVCGYTTERLPVMREGVRALLAQTIAPRQVIVVVDHAPELLEACRHEWGEGVEVVASARPQGLCGARNTGVEASTGDVVAFLDDDAVPAPDWIERLGAAYCDPEVIGVGGAIVPRWLDGRPRWFPREYDWVVGCTHSGMPRVPTPVRNLVGANMSFRRSALIELGGFRDKLGRVGANTAGAEETDLCIRARQRWPRRTILFEPAATVDHVVPPARAGLTYFRRRCLGEGRSKAILSGLVGSGDGLEAEREYVRRTLPLGFLRGLGDGLRGEAGGLERAAAIVYGLLVTGYGYATGLRMRPGRERSPAGPLRVLMVTPRSPLHPGGVERHVMEVSRRLAAAGNEVEVLCAEPGGPAVEERERDGVLIRAVRAWPADRDYYWAPRLWRELGRRRWDVIHVQSYHTLVAPLAMLRALTLRTPYLVTFHGGGHSSALRNRSRRAQRLLLGPLLRRAARLVAVARFEIDTYGEELNVPPERFALIPNGTEPAFSDAAATPRDGLPTIATIGRLERYKGHHRVIEAFPEVLAAEPEARLLVVGHGPYEEALRRQAENLGIAAQVEFTSVPAGDAAAMAALLGRVSLVTLMSEFETHPLVALEAVTAGCRLLVADTSGLAELVDEGVARGVPLDTAPAVLAAAALEELGKPPPEEMPDLISWDECAERLAMLYREVAARGEP
ncbi:MAG TPA: glycosyltransferase [Solirubrobacterales bacterium]|nr:glycosyltransferase [Solirubrobacterales bacterium]